MSNPLLGHGIHTAARLLYLLLKAFSVLAITSVPVSNRPGQEGGVFAQHNPLGACVLKVATLVAMGWDSNPRFSAYEADDLAASLPRSMNYFSHFGIIIIPQFCLFVKIRER